MKKFNEIKKLSIFLIICLTSTFIFAQNNITKKKVNIEALKIAFYTAKMNLNTEESKVFWPVVNEMENELKELKDKNALINYELKLLSSPSINDSFSETFEVSKVINELSNS